LAGSQASCNGVNVVPVENGVSVIDKVTVPTALNEVKASDQSNVMASHLEKMKFMMSQQKNLWTARMQKLCLDSLQAAQKFVMANRRASQTQDVSQVETCGVTFWAV
jgi:hypothetical protein